MLILQQVVGLEVRAIQLLDQPAIQLVEVHLTQLVEAQLSLIAGIHPLQPLGTTQQIPLTQNQEVGQLTIRLVDTRKVVEVLVEVFIVW
jgi:hypothetical protein